MKMDQIAYYCATHEQAERVKRQFGLHNATWAKDTVTANVSVAREGGLVDKSRIERRSAALRSRMARRCFTSWPPS